MKHLAAGSGMLVVIAIALIAYYMSVKSTTKATPKAKVPTGFHDPQRPSAQYSAINAPSKQLSKDDFNGLVPSPDGYLEGVEMLDAAWKIGRNTVNTYNRNASYDLREEPVIPKTLNASNNPFNNSSIVHSHLVDRKLQSADPKAVWKLDQVGYAPLN